MYCPNKKCIYANYINMGVPYCPRSVCVYKAAIEKELSKYSSRYFLHTSEVDYIKHLKEIYKSLEGG